MNFPRLSGRVSGNTGNSRGAENRSSASSLSGLSNGDDKIIDEIVSLPITMKGLVWKRREGMGKHLANLGKGVLGGAVKTTEAWEWRLMELRGTKLVYYYSDAEKKQYITKQQQTNWLIDQAKSTMGVGSSDISKPRGIFDLKDEKAAIHASFGHSGAPSPFCLSIQVTLLTGQAEVKYKFAFDSFAEQMEWLVAMTNVAVQASVDTYNVQLLQAVSKAVKTEHSDNEFSLFEHQASVREPPQDLNDENGGDPGGHRLWMMDKKDDLTTLKARAAENDATIASQQIELQQAKAEVEDSKQKLKVICTVLDQANNQIATLRKEKAAMSQKLASSKVTTSTTDQLPSTQGKENGTKIPLNDEARNMPEQLRQELDAAIEKSNSLELALAKTQEESQKAAKQVEEYRCALESNENSTRKTIEDLRAEMKTLQANHGMAMRDLRDENSLALEKQKSSLEESMRVSLEAKDKVHAEAMASATSAQAEEIDKVKAQMQQKINKLKEENKQLSKAFMTLLQKDQEENAKSTRTSKQ